MTWGGRNRGISGVVFPKTPLASLRGSLYVIGGLWGMQIPCVKLFKKILKKSSKYIANIYNVCYTGLSGANQVN